MTYSSIAISSGHSTKCQGADGIVNEVAEATKIVDSIAAELKQRGVKVEAYHDLISTTQNENLNRIVDWHNSRSRQIDISVHLNAYQYTSKPMGTEVLWVSQEALASELSRAIADAAGLPNRGAKYRNDLFFLGHTAQPAVLIEAIFCDSQADVDAYHHNYDAIIDAICDVLAEDDSDEIAPPPVQASFHVAGTCSYFGGPDDHGTAPDEGLALCQAVSDREELFLPTQPAGTTGLARRLNPYVHYIACRWNYDFTPKATLLGGVALVRNLATGKSLTAIPCDWGPAEWTGRAADLSPCLMKDLDLTTDEDEVEVIFPAPE